MTPLDWQRRFVETAIPDLLRVRADLEPPGLAAIVTGAGKGKGIAFLLRALREQGLLPSSIVVATSRADLVDTIEADLLAVFGPEVGVYFGRGKRVAWVTVTTYASLPKLLEQGEIGLLVCDEAHNTEAAATLKAVLAVPWRVGLTATPYLGDKTRTISAFGRVFFTLDREEAQQAGYIVPYRRVTLRTQEEYEAIDPGGSSAAGWSAGEEAQADRKCLRAAIALIDREGGPKAIGTMLFTASDLAVARAMAAELCEAGIRAVAVGGTTPKKELRSAIERSRWAGTDRPDAVDALVTVVLLTEGTDIQWIRAVVLTSWIGEQGRKFLAQLIGRGVRALRAGVCSEQDWIGPKTELVIFDPARIMQDRQLDHGATLGEAEERAVRLPKDPAKRAEACVARLEKLPSAQVVLAVEVWSGAIRDHAIRMAGREWASLPDARILQGEARKFPASDEQWRIARRDFEAAGQAIQPPEQREMMGLLIERGRALRGVVADLLIFLRWAAGRAVDQRRLKSNIFGGQRGVAVSAARKALRGVVARQAAAKIRAQQAADRAVEEGTAEAIAEGWAAVVAWVGMAVEVERAQVAVRAAGAVGGSDFAALRKVGALAARLPEGLMLPGEEAGDREG